MSSSASLPSSDNDYAAPLDAYLNKAFWDAALKSVGARIRALEAVKADWEELINTGTGQALAVIQANVEPQLVALTAIINQLKADVAAAEDAIAIIKAGGIDIANVAGLAAALALKAPLLDAQLQGSPTAPTPPIDADSARIVNVTALRAAVAALVDSAPATLDTLSKLANALGSDANFSTTITNALAATNNGLANRLRFDAAQALTTAQKTQAFVNLGVSFNSYFSKADYSSVVFTRPTIATVSLKAGTEVFVGGAILRYLVDTPVTMPALMSGTDYAIYVCADGTIVASANFSAPAGYTTANSRKIGGFHYAPGGNATAQAGGDTTPAINPYSLWDLKFRPACPDPRGMVLVANSFWCDIYLCGTDVDANGSSRYGVTIADGSSPPKIPVAFGGTGSTSYTSLTRWEAGEVLASVGKDLLTYSEFAAAAYGVSENVSRGNDPNATGYATSNVGSSNADNKFTSKWGVIQAAGCMWVWGREFGGPYNTTSGWVNNNGGRGQTYFLPNAALFGANWGDASSAGSRASYWGYAPSSSSDGLGARGRCDHLCHV